MYSPIYSSFSCACDKEDRCNQRIEKKQVEITFFYENILSLKYVHRRNGCHAVSPHRWSDA